MTVHLTAKIPADLKRDIEKLARTEERTMSAMVRRLLKQGVNTFKSSNSLQGVNTRTTPKS